MSVSDLEALAETPDLLSTPGALDEIRVAEAEIARGAAAGHRVPDRPALTRVIYRIDETERIVYAVRKDRLRW